MTLIKEVHPGSRFLISFPSILSTDPEDLPHLPLTAVVLIMPFSLLGHQPFLHTFFAGQLESSEDSVQRTSTLGSDPEG